LTGATEASRRGARLLGVGSAGSPLEAQCLSGGGSFVGVTRELSPRSSLWALAVPLLVAGSRFGLLDLGIDDEALEAAALQLESAASLCGPERDSLVNPAKTLAAELAGSLPMVWGAGQIGPVAALRAVSQIAENAKLPAIAGALPEAHHNQVVAFDGAMAGGGADDDLFRDRIDEPEPERLRLVVMRDDADDEVARRRAEVSAEIASGRGLGVTVLVAQGISAVERLASLVGLVDYASVYLGLAQGIDPTPITPIDELKRALAVAPYPLS
jgi:glucose/mannose-6-phosphate isomerase